jgi:hypothetical protein
VWADGLFRRLLSRLDTLLSVHDIERDTGVLKGVRAALESHKWQNLLCSLVPHPGTQVSKSSTTSVKSLLRDFRQGTAPALTRYSLFDSLPNTSNPRLADAQLIIAREYGYASWLKLKQRVDVPVRESAILEELVGL